MASAIEIIGKKAKQLYNAAGNRKKYTDCVKAAGKLYREGKLGAAKKAVKKAAKKIVRQTGSSSTKQDRERKAKPPGKRKAKSGRMYTERRKNRSDLPGRLTGTGLHVPAQIRAEMEQVNLAESMLETKRNALKGAKGSQRTQLTRDVKYWKKAIQMHKKNIINLKRLI
jgi:hypothetical protein